MHHKQTNVMRSQEVTQKHKDILGDLEDVFHFT